MLPISTYDGSQIFGKFYGSNLTDAELDIAAVKFIGDQHQEEETELFKTKWFDYRFMHSVKATHLFAHEYRKAYGKLCAIRMDYREIKTGMRGKDFTSQHKSVTTSFWNARRAADRYGIPYDFFAKTGMNIADSSLWKRIPSPGSLYNEDMLTEIVSLWNEELSARIIAPEHPFYSDGDFSEGFPEHHRDVIFEMREDLSEWLCELIKRRQHKYLSLGHYLVKNPILLLEVARRHFPDEEIERALNFYL